MIVYVWTEDENYVAPGATVIHSKEEILDIAKNDGKDLYIIGGSSLFVMFEAEVDELYRTVIHDTFDDVVHFPSSFDYNQFERVEHWSGPVDDKNKYPHTYEIWKRK